MPVSTESTIAGPFIPNGSTTEFAFAFKGASASEVAVVDQDGTYLSSALYSVVLDDDEGGTVVFSTAPELADYDSIYIIGDPDLTQPADFDNAGPSFNPAALTRALDRAALRDLKQQVEIDRAFKVPFDAASVAGQFPVVLPGGALGFSSGTGADDGLRTDLAASSGAELAGFIQYGTGSVARTVQDKLREVLSVEDKSGDLLDQLESIATDIPNGGNALIPRGNHTLAGEFLSDGYRLNLAGEGENVSIVNFNPAVATTAFRFARADAGGPYQQVVEKLGFYSTNSVDKIAILFENSANAIASRINIAEGGWLGADSIGIKTTGRQFTRIDRCVIGCARPIFIAANPTFPSLAADHFLIDECELAGTSATKPVVEFESGTSFAQTKIFSTAIVKGKDGVRWNDTSAAFAAGIHFHLSDVRFEQGLDATAYSVYLSTVNNSVQEALFVNCRFDANRNGVYLRNCLRVTFINCTFDNSGKTALDVTMVAGSRLEFVNCVGTGTFTITDGACTQRSLASRALGFSETWVYDTDVLSARAELANAPRATDRANIANAGRVKICDNSYSGKVHVHQRAGPGADFDVRGTANVAYLLPGTDISTAYSETLGTASKRNLAYDGAGADGAGYYLENNSGGAADFSWKLDGFAW